MTEITLEQIVVEVVAQVIARLQKENVKVSGFENTQALSEKPLSRTGDPLNAERVDMSAFRTPVITEKQLARLHERTGIIIVPCGTVITPRARRIIREKNLKIQFE